MRGHLLEKLGRGEEVRSESEMREEWRIQSVGASCAEKMDVLRTEVF